MGKRFSALLIEDGVVSAEQIEEALQRQSIYGGRLGTNLLEMGLIREPALLHYLSRAKIVPAVTPAQLQTIDPDALRLLDVETVERLRLMPLRLRPDGSAEVLVEDPLSARLIAEFKDITGYTFTPCIAPEFRFAQCLQVLYGRPMSQRFARLLAQAPLEVGLGEASGQASAAPPASAPPEGLRSAADYRRERQLGFGWSQTEATLFLRELYCRDTTLELLLGYAGNFALRRVLLVVARERLQGFSCAGMGRTAAEVREVRMPLKDDGPLEEVRRGATYFKGHPSEAALQTIYEQLDVSVPPHCVLLPIPVGPRAGLMLLLDDERLKIDIDALAPLFLTITEVTTTLERIIKLSKRDELPPEGLRVPAIPERHRHTQDFGRRRDDDGEPVSGAALPAVSAPTPEPPLARSAAPEMRATSRPEVASRPEPSRATPTRPLAPPPETRPLPGAALPAPGLALEPPPDALALLDELDSGWNLSGDFATPLLPFDTSAPELPPSDEERERLEEIRALLVELEAGAGGGHAAYQALHAQVDALRTALERGDIAEAELLAATLAEHLLASPLPPVFTAPDPAAPAPDPAAPAPEPAVAAPEPAVAAPEPAVAAPDPAVAAPEHAVAAPEHAVAAPDHAVAAPDHAGPPPEPAVAAPEPATPAPDPSRQTGNLHRIADADAPVRRRAYQATPPSGRRLFAVTPAEPAPPQPPPILGTEPTAEVDVPLPLKTTLEADAPRPAASAPPEIRVSPALAEPAPASVDALESEPTQPLDLGALAAFAASQQPAAAAAAPPPAVHVVEESATQELDLAALARLEAVRAAHPEPPAEATALLDIPLELLEEEPLLEVEPLPGFDPETMAALNSWRPWVQRLSSPNPAEVERASQVLLASGGTALPALLESFPGPLRQDRYAHTAQSLPPYAEHGPLLAVLLGFGDLAAPALVGLLGMPSAEVRFYATFFFDFVKYDPAIVLIFDRIFDRDGTVRDVARRILRHQRSAAASTGVLGRLRREARAVSDPWRCEQAIVTLGALLDVESVPLLAPLVEGGHRRLQEVAHRALCTIALDDHGFTARRWERWHARSAAEPRHRWLIEALNHGDEAIRELAAAELRTIPGLVVNYAPQAPRPLRQRAQKVVADFYQQP